MFARRQFLSLLSFLPFMAPRPVVAAPIRRYTVPPTLWYENAAGEKWLPPTNYNGFPDPPAGYIYQWSQFPCTLEESCCTHDGKIMGGHSGWPQSLVLAMATSGDYKLSEAILIAAHLCERCMNAAAHQYGLDWGYPERSTAWHRANTRCNHCEPK